MYVFLQIVNTIFTVKTEKKWKRQNKTEKIILGPIVGPRQGGPSRNSLRAGASRLRAGRGIGAPLHHEMHVGEKDNVVSPRPTQCIAWASSSPW